GRGGAWHGRPGGPDRRRARRQRGLRLRPDLRAGRGGADGLGAWQRVEGRELASRPRRTRPLASHVLAGPVRGLTPATSRQAGHVTPGRTPPATPRPRGGRTGTN